MPLGDISQCLGDIFHCHSWRVECYWSPAGGGRDAVEHPTKHRAGPVRKDNAARGPAVPRPRTPALGLPLPGPPAARPWCSPPALRLPSLAFSPPDRSASLSRAALPTPHLLNLCSALGSILLSLLPFPRAQNNHRFDKDGAQTSLIKFPNGRLQPPAGFLYRDVTLSPQTRNSKK